MWWREGKPVGLRNARRKQQRRLTPAEWPRHLAQPRGPRAQRPGDLKRADGGRHCLAYLTWTLGQGLAVSEKQQPAGKRGKPVAWVTCILGCAKPTFLIIRAILVLGTWFE